MAGATQIQATGADLIISHTSQLERHCFKMCTFKYVHFFKVDRAAVLQGWMSDQDMLPKRDQLSVRRVAATTVH